MLSGILPEVKSELQSKGYIPQEAVLDGTVVAVQRLRIPDNPRLNIPVVSADLIAA